MPCDVTSCINCKWNKAEYFEKEKVLQKEMLHHRIVNN